MTLFGRTEPILQSPRPANVGFRPRTLAPAKGAFLRQVSQRESAISRGLVARVGSVVQVDVGLGDI